MISSGEIDSGMDCREWNKVLAFYSGQLPEADLESIVNHLSTCPDCEAGIQKLKGSSSEDDFTRDIRSCMIRSVLRESDLGYQRMAAGALETASTGILAPHAETVEEPPRTIGDYEIVNAIGHGGMGIVYRGRQPPLEHYVAIKMIRAGIYAGNQAIQRFSTEMQAISRLRHPNVVQLFHTGTHDNLPYYVMEWIDGGSLAVKLTKGPLPFREAAELIYTLACAVAFAHQNNVIHRDLKPSNILLNSDNAPKIADFGLAKLLDSDDQLTVSDTVLGTPSYMSPEQAAGNRSEIGLLTDVYAMGAIFYEVLTGKAPFVGENKVQTMRMILEEALISPRKLRPEIPRDLSDICMKCLEKMPAKRYSSAQALAGDIQRWLNGQRPRETPRLLARLGRVLRRNVALIVPVMLIAMLSVFGIVLSMRERKQPTADPDKVLREYERDLAQGNTVTLIGETGDPKWFRWRAGENSSKTTQAQDDTFRVYAPDTSLLELLPDPQSEHYRFAVKIRHDNSNPGMVGIYFGRQSLSVGDDDIHFFTKTVFDDLREQQAPVQLGNKKNFKPLPYVNVTCDLYSERRDQPVIHEMTVLPAGPSFAFAGKPLWHNLEVTVTPEGVRAKFDDKPFEVVKAKITTAITDLTNTARKRHTLLNGVQPNFVSRGGLGLYVYRGSASFCSASIAPLSNPEK